MVIAGYDPDARTILTEAQKKDLTIPAMGGDGLEQIALAGPVANGTYVTSSYFPQTDTPANRRFVEAYRARFPNAGDPNGSGAAAYDAVYMLRESMLRVGTTRKAIRDDFAGIGTTNPAYEGAMGTIAFDENATCERFLNELVLPAVHAEDADLLQRFAGMYLLGYNRAQRLLILDGEGGRGKTQFANVMQGLVGMANSTQLRTKHLAERFELS